MKKLHCGGIEKVEPAAAITAAGAEVKALFFQADHFSIKDTKRFASTNFI